MQLLPLALIFAIYFHDMFGPPEQSLTPLSILTLFILPKLFFTIAYTIFCKIVFRRLGSPSTPAALKRLDQASNIYRAAIVATFALDLTIGCLVVTRNLFDKFTGFQDPILLDELLLLFPPLAMIIIGWAAYYPIDRRLREASLIRQLDSGLPIYPIWTKKQYLIAQFRNQIALILGPLLLLLAWTEIVFCFKWQFITDLTKIEHPYFIPQLLGAAAIFIIAPLLITKIFDTTTLPNGPLRHRLVDICKLHNINIRQLLLWRTYGGMVNAAVIGIIPQIRYILVSDGLLDMLPPQQVDAVMAHEIAHVRKHHMFWLILSAMALLGTGDWLFLPLFDQLFSITSHQPVEVAAKSTASWTNNLFNSTTLATIATISLWILGFGWVSRRFERQADSFAVQHLNQQLQTDFTLSKTQTQSISPLAVETMSLALQNVAKFNHTPATRRSWRHGSIAWRQNYLQTLTNHQLNTLPIDRLITRIKLISLLGMIVWTISWTF